MRRDRERERGGGRRKEKEQERSEKGWHEQEVRARHYIVEHNYSIGLIFQWRSRVQARASCASILHTAHRECRNLKMLLQVSAHLLLSRVCERLFSLLAVLDSLAAVRMNLSTFFAFLFALEKALCRIRRFLLGARGRCDSTPMFTWFVIISTLFHPSSRLTFISVALSSSPPSFIFFVLFRSESVCICSESSLHSAQIRIWATFLCKQSQSHLIFVSANTTALVCMYAKRFDTCSDRNKT